MQYHPLPHDVPDLGNQINTSLSLIDLGKPYLDAWETACLLSDIHWLEGKFGISLIVLVRQSNKKGIMFNFKKQDPEQHKILTSKNTLVACSVASSGVISNKGICIGFLDAGPSVNYKKGDQIKSNKIIILRRKKKWGGSLEATRATPSPWFLRLSRDSNRLYIARLEWRLPQAFRRRIQATYPTMSNPKKRSVEPKGHAKRRGKWIDRQRHDGYHLLSSFRATIFLLNLRVQGGHAIHLETRWKAPRICICSDRSLV